VRHLILKHLLGEDTSCFAQLTGVHRQIFDRCVLLVVLVTCMLHGELQRQVLLQLHIA
jgi:hypothetical protein